MDYIFVFLLILLSGLFSGLTLGLLSLDKSELERKIEAGNDAAKKVYDVRKNGNLLLCTLLLGNVAVNSTIAIVLGNISSGLVAGIVSTTIIVLFGEIIPQALFARYALHIGAKTAWLVKIFMYILFPVCFPIAYILDKALGDEMATIYSKKELLTLVKEHASSAQSDVDMDEGRIIGGALSFSDMRVKEIMTPKHVLYAIEKKATLTKALLQKIKKEGYTRIPVYDMTIDNTVGVLYIQDLINIPPKSKVEKMYKKEKVLTVKTSEKLDNVLNMFLRAKVHLAFVKNKEDKLVGIVTLEDIVEEILGHEIMDEKDDEEFGG